MANTQLSLRLDDWQKEAIQHDGNLLLCTGRQLGKTTTMARKAAEFMLNNPNSQIIVASLTEDQAKLIIAMTLNYLEQNYKPQIDKRKQRTTTRKVTLKNKSQILARPVGTTGDAIRGFTGDVLIVDEASRMPPDMWAAAKPTLFTTGGQIWMCSTPFGKTGYFYECYLNERNKFKVIHVNSEDVAKTRPISERWTKEAREAALEHLKEEKASMPAHQYAQEYLAMFLDDINQFFPDDLIKECMAIGRRNHVIKDREYYLGVDVGAGESETTYEIIEKLRNGKFEHIENIIELKNLTTFTSRQILRLDREYNFKNIFIDDGGIGYGVFSELLEDPQTRRKTIAINNARRPLDKDNKQKKKILKEDLYNNLLNLMQKGNIKLLEDPEIYQSLKSVQYSIEDGRFKIFGNYTHIVEGLIRAAWCAKTKHLNIHIHWI